MDPVRPHVYVILVNWNGWRDTLECLESVFRSDHRDFRVIVSDNASTDGSVERMRAWAAGVEELSLPEGPLARLVTPPAPKPIETAVLSRAEAERGAGGAPPAARLVIVETGANIGFAAGCNVGMRYALAQPDCGHIWLLNNDTVIEPGALGALVRRMDASPGAGQCGARLVYYDEPGTMQAYGGAEYDRWLGRSRPIGMGEPVRETVDVRAIEARTDYVVGASIFSPRRFVEEVGLLEESYFMYHEELDWAARARGRWTMVYAHDAVVYHKEGRGMGSNRQVLSRSLRSDFYQLRSRLRYTWLHERRAIATVALGVVGAVLNRLRRRQPDRAWLALRILLDPSTYSRSGRPSRLTPRAASPAPPPRGGG